MKRHLICIATVIFLPTTLIGQTVTVNKASTGTYTTIGAALAHFTVDPDPTADNVIQITDTGLYEEVFTIEVPVTIEAPDARATLAVLGNTNTLSGNGGIFINLPSSMTTGAVTLRNLSILPALSTQSDTTVSLPIKEVQTAIENGNNNLFLTVDRCLIVPNDGTNNPLVIDGVANKVVQLIPTNAAYNENIVQWGDDGIVLGRVANRFEGDGVELLVKDTVISHLRLDVVRTPSTIPTCIVMANEYGTDPQNFPNLFRRTRIEGASGISFAVYGLECAGDVDMRSSTDRIQMRGHGHRAINFTGIAQNYRNVFDTVIEGISQDSIVDDGYGIVRMNMNNSIVWSAPRSIFRLHKPSADLADGNIVIRNSTLVASRAASNFHTIRLETGTHADMLIEDSIIGGKINASTHGFNVISLSGENHLTLNGAALVTAGPYALRASAPISLGTSATVQTINPSTNADPQFTGISAGYLPSNPDFTDVQAPEYATASSTGGPLGGGADYIGQTSALHEWPLYSDKPRDVRP